MKQYTGTPEPGLLGTILHEATHNLGPAHEYKVGGKTDREVFGGPLASMLEELKAQTGALFLVDFLRGKKLVTADESRRRVTPTTSCGRSATSRRACTTATARARPTATSPRSRSAF